MILKTHKYASGKGNTLYLGGKNSKEKFWCFYFRYPHYRYHKIILILVLGYLFASRYHQLLICSFSNSAALKNILLRKFESINW